MNHARGVSEALADFGLEKSAYASAAVGGLLGAGMGYLADPENSWQAAAMGGAAGAAMGHGIGNMTGGNRSPAAPKAPAPAAAPPPVPAAPKPQVPLNAEMAAATHEAQMRQYHEEQKNHRAPVPSATLEELRAGAPHIPRSGPQIAVPQAPPAQAPAAKVTKKKKPTAASKSLHAPDEVGKVSVDHGLSVGPGGPGVSVFDPPKERLPGMHRWVPRETIEDVYRQLDMGVDPEGIQTNDSPTKLMMSGGILGGMTGLSLGKSPAAGLAGAGVGAAAGLGAHLLGSKNRRADTQEALYGVTRERNQELKGHALKQPQDSARESMPITVSTNVGM